MLSDDDRSFSYGITDCLLFNFEERRVRCQIIGVEGDEGLGRRIHADFEVVLAEVGWLNADCLSLRCSNLFLALRGHLVTQSFHLMLVV